MRSGGAGRIDDDAVVGKDIDALLAEVTSLLTDEPCPTGPRAGHTSSADAALADDVARAERRRRLVEFNTWDAAQTQMHEPLQLPAEAGASHAAVLSTHSTSKGRLQPASLPATSWRATDPRQMVAAHEDAPAMSHGRAGAMPSIVQPWRTTLLPPSAAGSWHPANRSGFSTAMCRRSGTLFVFGGTGGHTTRGTSAAADSMFAFHIPTAGWHESFVAAGSSPACRRYHAMAVIDADDSPFASSHGGQEAHAGLVCVFGGLSAVAQRHGTFLLNDVHIYDARNQNWLEVQCQTSDIPSPRCHVSLSDITADTQQPTRTLLIFGGRGDKLKRGHDNLERQVFASDELWKLDIRLPKVGGASRRQIEGQQAATQWTRVWKGGSRADGIGPTPRWGHSSVVLPACGSGGDHARLLICGGEALKSGVIRSFDELVWLADLVGIHQCSPDPTDTAPTNCCLWRRVDLRGWMGSPAPGPSAAPPTDSSDAPAAGRIADVIREMNDSALPVHACAVSQDRTVVAFVGLASAKGGLLVTEWLAPEKPPRASVKKVGSVVRVDAEFIRLLGSSASSSGTSLFLRERCRRDGMDNPSSAATAPAFFQGFVYEVLSLGPSAATLTVSRTFVQEALIDAEMEMAAEALAAAVRTLFSRQATLLRNFPSPSSQRESLPLVSDCVLTIGACELHCHSALLAVRAPQLVKLMTGSSNSSSRQVVPSVSRYMVALDGADRSTPHFPGSAAEARPVVHHGRRAAPEATADRRECALPPQSHPLFTVPTVGTLFQVLRYAYMGTFQRFTVREEDLAQDTTDESDVHPPLPGHDDPNGASPTQADYIRAMRYISSTLAAKLGLPAATAGGGVTAAAAAHRCLVRAGEPDGVHSSARWARDDDAAKDQVLASFRCTMAQLRDDVTLHDVTVRVDDLYGGGESSDVFTASSFVLALASPLFAYWLQQGRDGSLGETIVVDMYPAAASRQGVAPANVAASKIHIVRELSTTVNAIASNRFRISGLKFPVSAIPAVKECLHGFPTRGTGAIDVEHALEVTMAGHILQLDGLKRIAETVASYGPELTTGSPSAVSGCLALSLKYACPILAEKACVVAARRIRELRVDPGYLDLPNEVRAMIQNVAHELGSNAIETWSVGRSSLGGGEASSALTVRKSQAEYEKRGAKAGLSVASE